MGVADDLRRRVLSHTEPSMTLAKNELLSLCEAIDHALATVRREERERCLKINIRSVECPSCRAGVDDPCKFYCACVPRYRAAIRALGREE